MEVHIITKAEAIKLAKKTKTLNVVISPNDPCIFFTNNPGVPIGKTTVTNIDHVVHSFPTKIYEHDPKEHRTIKDIETFLLYYYPGFKLIETY